MTPSNLSKLHFALAGLTAAVLLGSSAAVLLKPGQGHRNVQAALVVDESESVDDPCADTDLVGRGLIAFAAGRPLTVHPFYTTDRDNGGLGKNVPDISFAGGSAGFEGAGLREKHEKAFLQALHDFCTNGQRRHWSPVFGGVRVAVEDLRTRGCGTGRTACVLVVKSDGNDNVDSVLRDRLRKRSVTGEPRLEVDSFDRVVFCDLARRGPGKAPDDKVIEAAWRAELAPDTRATFSPFCNEDLLLHPVLPRPAQARQSVRPDSHRK